MAQPVILPAFAAGELSPSLYGRVDLAKYHTGAALLRNFFVDFRGGASTRPGTRFVGRTVTNTENRLIPFTFSTLQAYALVFGNNTMRVVQDGGWVLEANLSITGITNANPGVFTTLVAHGYSVLQEVYISGVGGMTEVNGRNFTIVSVTTYTFTLVDLYGNTIDTTLFTPYTSGGYVARVYTAVSPYAAADLALLKYSQTADTMTLTHATGAYEAYELTRSSPVNWTFTPVVYGSGTGAPTISSVTTSGAGTNTYYVYAVTALNKNGVTESVPSAQVSVGCAAPMSGNNTVHNTVNWTTLAGAIGYKIYRTLEAVGTTPASGSLLGYIGSTDATGVSFVDQNIIPDLSQTPPVNFNPFASGNNPFCSTYYQGRQVFGGSVNDVQALNFSKSSDYLNMDYSTPSRADDAIAASLISQQVNAIKHLVPTISLIALTSSGAWRIDGGGQGAPVTPSSILALPQVYNGCSDVPPLLVNHDILYVQALGSIVRDLTYNFYVNIYTGTDVSALSNHFFYGHQITEWAWSEEPNRLVWAVRDDGILLGFTYFKEQDIYAWTRHDTNGLFQSVCSIPEGTENAVYMIVERFIEGQYVQYVERLASRVLGSDYPVGIPGDLTKAWCVDAGLEYPLTAPGSTLTPSGLTGTISLSSSTSYFTVGMVGDVVRINGGTATITTWASGLEVLATVTTPLLSVWPTTNWTIATPTTVVTGLDHLDGMTVTGLADGGVISPRVVSNGSITLDFAATAIIIGLGFTCQMQTLPLDVGEPTIQGKRKKLAAVTLRVKDSRGLSVGPNFNSLLEMKEYGQTVPLGTAVPLVTADQRLIMTPQWTVPGQIAIQQSYPLPATVLAVIPEVTVGDTPQ